MASADETGSVEDLPAGVSGRAVGAGLHPLVDANVSSLFEQRYVARRDGGEFYLADHVVFGRRVWPAVAYVELARVAGELASGSRVGVVRGVSFERVLEFVGGVREVGIVVVPAVGGGVGFEVVSEGLVCARGELGFGEVVGGGGGRVDVVEVRGRCGRVVDVGGLYEGFAGRGLSYGPGFRSVVGVVCGDREALGSLRLPGVCEAGFGEFGLHPSLMDGALQSVVALLGESAGAGAGAGAGVGVGVGYLPFAVGAVEIFGELPRECLAHVTVEEDAGRAGAVTAQVALLDAEGTVLVRIKDLVLRADQRQSDAGADRGPERLLFRGQWERAALPTGGTPPDGPYLLLGTDEGQRTELAAALRAAGRADARIVLARPGAAFQRQDAHTFTLDPGRGADVDRLLADCAADDLLPGVVLHAWNDLDSLDGPDGLEAGAVDRALARGLMTHFHLGKALLARRIKRPVRVLHLHAAGVDGPSPLQDAVAGFARSARLENPRLVHQVVGLERPADALTTAVAELGDAADPAVWVRHKDGRRLVHGHRRIDPPRPADRRTPVREDGVYLITGGAGGLGLLVAEHLAAQARTHLVLVGRSEPDQDVRRRMAAIEAHGGTVRHLRADVADAESVRELVARVRAEHGALHGVVHAAGTLRDSFLLKKTAEEFAAVLAPKIAGAVHLDHYTRDEQLDFFVLFSSIAAAFGNLGQTDYAAANAFLDAFAEHRTARVAAGRRHGRSLSIAWPHWRDGGMALAAHDAAVLRERIGVASLGNEEGLAAFDDALALPGGAVLVAAGDAGVIAGRLAAVGTAADDRPGDDAGIGAEAAPTAAGGADDGAELRGIAVAFLRELVARKIGAEASGIDPKAALLARYGIDSLVITELNRALEDRFGELSKTLFFEHDSLEEIADHLVETKPEALRPATAEAPATAAAPAVEPARRPRFMTSVRIETPDGGPGHGPGHGTPDDGVENDRAEGDRAEDDAAEDDAIAVIGLSGRYPMADDLGEFWENLAQGRDCITEVPRERWDHERFFDADASRAGGTYGKWGGFLSDVDKFDPLFFSVSPREAELMDPQERLFLQSAWHVLEDAGYRARALGRRKVGVFVGVMYGEYQLYGALDALRGTGPVTESSYSLIANRVSYLLDLHGPSMAVDTMCSSSLTALHLACESLRHGESELAIAGGVNVSVHPYKYVLLSQSKFLSTDGRCRAFGAGGSGYVPGEGVGSVLLKPLARAIEDGDHVYGVIRGTAVNHGGRPSGSGYTVPNPRAQERVIAAALGRAGVEPGSVSYVEAHGTGTSLGDPIEITGLRRAFGGAG
ncbi:SDR family NAD(P)-dependent oxidoreductase, partial [Streptomyces noursei]